MGRGPRGNPPGRVPLLGARDGLLDAPRAARRGRRAQVHRRRRARGGRPPNRTGVRGGGAHAAGRSRAPARDRLRGPRGRRRPPPTARAGSPSTRPRSCFAPAALPVVDGRAGLRRGRRRCRALGARRSRCRQAERALVAAQGRRGRPVPRRAQRGGRQGGASRPRRARRRGRRACWWSGWRRPAPSCSWPRARTPWCRASWWAPAASGPRRWTTPRWCRCPQRPSGWRQRSAPCARPRSSPAAAAGRRSTWPQPPGWPPRPASSSSRAGSSCSS